MTVGEQFGLNSRRPMNPAMYTLYGDQEISQFRGLDIVEKWNLSREEMSGTR